MKSTRTNYGSFAVVVSCSAPTNMICNSNKNRGNCGNLNKMDDEKGTGDCGDNRDSSSDEDEDPFGAGFGGAELMTEDATAAQRRAHALEQRERRNARDWTFSQSSVQVKYFFRSPAKEVEETQNEDKDKDNKLEAKTEMKTNLFLEQNPGKQAMMIWDCAVVLARYLEKSKITKGLSVVELGCGIGLPGLVSASVGAEKVLLTDRLDAVESIQKQIELNPFLSSKVLVEALEWEKSREYFLQVKGKSDLEQMNEKDSIIDNNNNNNNSNDNKNQKYFATFAPFQAILCSDVIYAGDQDTTKHLVETIDLISNDDTIVISCYELRHKGSYDQAGLFQTEMKAIGFCNERTIESHEMDDECQDSQNIPISIFTRKAWQRNNNS